MTKHEAAREFQRLLLMNGAGLDEPGQFLPWSYDPRDIFYWDEP